MLGMASTEETQEIRKIIINEVAMDCRKLSKTKSILKKSLILKQIERKIAIYNM